MTNYWTNDIIDPDEIVAYAILPESSQAFQTGWVNHEAQELARDGAAEPDPAKRMRCTSASRRFTTRSRRCRPLLPAVRNVTTTRVHNFGHPPTGQFDWRNDLDRAVGGPQQGQRGT